MWYYPDDKDLNINRTIVLLYIYIQFFQNLYIILNFQKLKLTLSFRQIFTWNDELNLHQKNLFIRSFNKGNKNFM